MSLRDLIGAGRDDAPLGWVILNACVWAWVCALFWTIDAEHGKAALIGFASVFGWRIARAAILRAMEAEGRDTGGKDG